MKMGSGFSVRALAVICLGLGSLLFARPQTPVQQNQPKPVAKSIQPDNLLASIERTGGYAGVYDRFDIYHDGKVASSEGKTQQVPVQELAPIRRRIQTLDVPNSCQIVYQAGLCSDCFRYRITFMGPAGKITLVLEEPQMGGPDSVSKLARDLRDLVASLKWK